MPWVRLCYQAGCHTLKDIATEVGIPLGSAFASNATIHVSRAEYDAACEQLSSAGVPLKADREESWQAFVSMRSQSDFALIALANFLRTRARGSLVLRSKAWADCTRSGQVGSL